MPAYQDTINNDVIDKWKWCSAEKKVALQALVTAASTASPGTFLSELITALGLETTNYVPEFAATLKRWQNEYTVELAKLAPGGDADALLESIIREWGVPPSAGDLV